MEPTLNSPLPVSLETYKALVDRCARERLNYPIANGSASHARILIEKLFDVAEENVCIVSGTLRQKSHQGVHIYSHDRVINSARKFLSSSDTNLRVIVQTGEIDGGAENSFLTSVIGDKMRKGSVTIYMPKLGTLSSERTPHFMVSDQAVYRFETGKDASPQNESITAVANFGDAGTGQVLGEIFDNIIALSEVQNNISNQKTFQPGMQYTSLLT